MARHRASSRLSSPRPGIRVVREGIPWNKGVDRMVPRRTTAILSLPGRSPADARSSLRNASSFQVMSRLPGCSISGSACLAQSPEMMGEFPRNRYSSSPVFSCRCAGSFQSLKPGTRRTPSSTRRRLSGWTAYRARSCGMKGVFFSVGACRLSSSASPEASFFPSSPEISKVRDMTACTTGADLIFP